MLWTLTALTDPRAVITRSFATPRKTPWIPCFSLSLSLSLFLAPLAPALTRYHLPPLFSSFLLHYTLPVPTSSITLTHPSPTLPLVSALAAVLALLYRLVILSEESDYSKLSIGRIYRLDPIAMLRETCRCLSRIRILSSFLSRPTKLSVLQPMLHEFSTHFQMYRQLMRERESEITLANNSGM